MTEFESRLYSGHPTASDIDVLHFIQETLAGLSFEQLLGIGFDTNNLRKLLGISALLTRFSYS